MLKKFVIASTFSPAYQIDPRRTPYLFSNDAILEVIKQCKESALGDGHPLEVLNKPPVKADAMPMLGPDGRRLADVNRPRVIARIVDAWYYEDTSNGCKQAHASFDFFDEQEAVRIKNNINSLCLFPLIRYSTASSLKTAVAMADEEDQIHYLYPPLQVVGFNIGEKRSSSNPYLMSLDD